MKQGIIAVIVIVILGVGGWYYFSHGMPSAGAPSASNAGATVATVNGQDITQAQLTSAEAQLASQAGVSATTTDPTIKSQLQSQALDSLIGQTLLEQAAQQGGYTASSTQVDAQLQSIKSQFGSDSAYQQALQQQGLTEDQLKAQIAQGLAVQAYLEATLHLSAVTATDAEIQSAYNQVAAQQGTSTPPLSQVKSQVEQLVVNQKQQQLVSQQVQKLRAGANVQVLISTSPPQA